MTNLYDVCELWILRVKGKVIYFLGAKEILQQLFVPDQANGLLGLLEADKERVTEPGWGKIRDIAY
jgi:hypothetical protein